MAQFPRQPISPADELKIARALLRRAVALPGPRAIAMNGDIEDAFSRLGEAAIAVRADDTASAVAALAEALELLTSSQSIHSAQDDHALRLAVRHANGALRRLA
jgi:hypothetical protein